MKKTSKLIVALLIVLTIATISVSSFAVTNPDAIRPDQIKGSNIGTSTAQGILDFGNNIVGVVRIVGIVVAVIILLVLGIKYMMGSAEEKADYKKSMIPYMVGAILIFASSTIVGIVYDLANSLNNRG